MRYQASQIVRQVYVDLVRRRCTVRILPSQSITSSEPPIFVVAPYRSGTTLVRYIIDSHSRIACPPESDFLATLSPLLLPGRPQQGLLSMGFDDEHVTQRVRAFADYFFGNYARSAGKSRWADKSPTYVEHLPFLRRLYPGAQFVFVHRHPLDQIHSHTRGGSHTNSFIEAHRRDEGEDVRFPAARYWVAATTSMHAFACVDTNSIEISYESLCKTPEKTLRHLFGFLGERWEPTTLRFAETPHDLGMEAAKTRATTGIQYSGGRYAEWPRTILQGCDKIVRDTAASVGYTSSSPSRATAPFNA